MRLGEFVACGAIALLMACGPAASPGPQTPQPAEATLGWDSIQGPSDRIAVIEGLAGPESVRYDPEQDVYFVSNFNGGGGNDRDADGFISRVLPAGEIQSLQFMVGTAEHPLHAPRGMAITGGTLWAVDIDGVHGFDRVTGKQTTFVDFTPLHPGFLNDVAPGPDGALYVTDTGVARIYRILDAQVTIAVQDDALGPPNGITWDPEHELFWIAPWGGTHSLPAWGPGSGEVREIATSPGGNFDGIELVGSRVLVASQNDTSLQVVSNGVGRQLIRTQGRPADIGIDTRRYRVAVPYIELDRVDIWQLPAW